MRKKLNKIVNSTQRRLPKAVANIRWPEKISSEDPHTLLQHKSWSTTMKLRRLNFVGHMLRQKPDTPVRKNLAQAARVFR